MSGDQNSSNAIGVPGLLLVAFVVLKLCKVIDWDWMWVLAPAWIPLVVALGALVIYAVICIVASVGKGHRRFR